mmetsp:Transcript_34827/g.57605  ORF Transcript_34827/g.57605 Transcript_34827/m.57605 type:complete len:334 (-) Transcript_34827:22-1023(-)
MKVAAGISNSTVASFTGSAATRAWAQVARTGAGAICPVTVRKTSLPAIAAAASSTPCAAAKSSRPARTERKGTQSSPYTKADMAGMALLGALSRGAKTGGGAKQKPRSLTEGGGGGGSASSLSFRRWKSRITRSPEVPAPREWPVTTSSYPGFFFSAQTTESPASLQTDLAIAAIPECARPPQNDSACATASWTTSEREAVPRRARTIALWAWSASTMWRRHDALPVRSSDSVSSLRTSAAATPVCSQMHSFSSVSMGRAICSLVRVGIRPKTSISAEPYAADAKRMKCAPSAIRANVPVDDAGFDTSVVRRVSQSADWTAARSPRLTVRGRA